MSILIKHLDLPPIDEYIHLAINSKGEVYDDSDYMDDLDFDPKPITYAKEVSDVEPVRHGHWKVVNDGYGGEAYICECSECEDTVWVYKNADRKWNYCPNCGAKMDGEEQEHE